MILYDIALIIILLFTSFLILIYVYFLFATISAAPYVPSSKVRIKKMIEMIDKPLGSTILELGSGDGKVMIALAKQGFNVIGIEINPVLCWFSKFRIRRQGLKNAKIINKNFWNYDLKDVDIMTMYFIPHKMKKLAKKIKKEMKPGSIIVSNAFKLDDWPIDKQDGKVYVYVV